jgi:hypothetical protein
MLSTTRRQFVVSLGAVAGGTLIGLPVRRASAGTGATTLSHLHISAVLVPKLRWTGKELTFGATIKNVGSVATADGRGIRVVFEVDGVQVTWSVRDLTRLAAGASVTLLATSTWTATVGVHTLKTSVKDVGTTGGSSVVVDSTSETFTVSPPTRPVNTVRPVISGQATVGHQLHVSTGTWSQG